MKANKDDGRMDLGVPYDVEVTDKGQKPGECVLNFTANGGKFSLKFDLYFIKNFILKGLIRFCWKVYFRKEPGAAKEDFKKMYAYRNSVEDFLRFHDVGGRNYWYKRDPE